MRIAYVSETFPPEINGVALTAQRTVRHLRRAGHAVQLTRPRQPARGDIRHDTRHDTSADVFLLPGLNDSLGGVRGCLAPPCGGPAAADAFMAAATRALRVSAPGSPLRLHARLAAIQADGCRVPRRFGQQLLRLAA